MVKAEAISGGDAKKLTALPQSNDDDDNVNAPAATIFVAARRNMGGVAKKEGSGQADTSSSFGAPATSLPFGSGNNTTGGLAMWPALMWTEKPFNSQDTDACNGKKRV